MWNKLKAGWAHIKEIWNSLPHQVQAVLTVFATTAATASIDAVSSGDFSVAHLKHALGIGFVAGLIAAKTLMSLPSNAQEKIDAQNKAQEVK